MLFELLPQELYQNAEQVRDLQGALDAEIVKLGQARDSVLAQMRPGTASWGLAQYEKEYGIPTDESIPPESRLSSLRAKRRGYGTTTVKMLKTVAESFANGVVDVTEFPAESRFEVKFVGTIGLPPRIQDLSAALEDIKPAHLAYGFIIGRRIWRDMSRFTWLSLVPNTWEQILEGQMNGQNTQFKA